MSPIINSAVILRVLQTVCSWRSLLERSYSYAAPLRHIKTNKQRATVCRHCIGTNMSNFLQALMPDILLNDYFGTNNYRPVWCIAFWDLPAKWKNLTAFGVRWVLMSDCRWKPAVLVKKFLVNAPNTPGDWMGPDSCLLKKIKSKRGKLQRLYLLE